MDRQLIVVGVSTFDSHRWVVAWAAAEAAARDAELRLLTARPGPAAPDRYLPSDPAPAYRAAAELELAGMVVYVNTGWPGLSVSTELATGPPAEVLRAAAEYADLLVVGADDASPFTEAISGSVPGDLLATAPCPLAVVPRREWTPPTAAPVAVAGLRTGRHVWWRCTRGLSRCSRLLSPGPTRRWTGIDVIAGNVRGLLDQYAGCRQHWVGRGP